MKNLTKKHNFRALLCLLLSIALLTPKIYSQAPEIPAETVSDNDPYGYLPGWLAQLEDGLTLQLETQEINYINENLVAIRLQKSQVTYQLKKALALEAEELIAHYQQMWEQLHTQANNYYAVLHAVLDEQ